MPFALAIHGGAWNIPDDEVASHELGLLRPLTRGYAALAKGASALDVVETVVRALEDDPTFNAGRGAHLNAAGDLELDASIMDGTDLSAGAVASVDGVRHPVSLARRVLERSPHVLLVGDGARSFARATGVERCPTRSLLVGRELARWKAIRAGDRSLVRHEFSPRRHPHGTVGAVARDRRGRLAAATSTGGTQDKAPGRVGDSPIIGAGTYADGLLGAATCTGWGEAILRVALAHTAVAALAGRAAPDAAAAAALAALRRVKGFGGLVIVDRRGRAAARFNTPRMARGIADALGIRVAVDRGDRAR